MPNLTYNKLVIKNLTDEERKTIIREMQQGDARYKSICEGDDDSDFDFNNLIPMPQVLLDVTIGSTTIDGESVTEWITDENGKNIAVTEEERAEWLSNYGAVNWYDWAIENWSVKWNASEVQANHDEEMERLTYEFITPWSVPVKVYEAFLKKYATLFPHMSVSVTYKFEDWEDDEYATMCHNCTHESVKHTEIYGAIEGLE